jgi:hypothetical protein
MAAVDIRKVGQVAPVGVQPKPVVNDNAKPKLDRYGAGDVRFGKYQATAGLGGIYGVASKIYDATGLALLKQLKTSTLEACNDNRFASFVQPIYEMASENA